MFERFGQHVDLEPAEQLRDARPHERNPHHDERPIRLQQAAKELRVREIEVGKQQPRHDFAAVDVEEPLLAPSTGTDRGPAGRPAKSTRRQAPPAPRPPRQSQTRSAECPFGRIERLELEEQNQAQRRRPPRRRHRPRPGESRQTTAPAGRHEPNEGDAVNKRRRRQAHQEANRPPELLVRHRSRRPSRPNRSARRQSRPTTSASICINRSRGFVANSATPGASANVASAAAIRS